MFDSILVQIEKAESVVVLSHINPDGDAIGSMLAVYAMLKKMGKDVDMIMSQHSKVFDFLPFVDEIKKEGRDKYDLAIAVDTAEPERLNWYSSYFESAKSTIVIDHHISNIAYADINYVDSEAPACAQILISLFKHFNIEISKEIATCLITGIITDTGGFRYPATTSETFEFASEALRKGVDISMIYKHLFGTRTRASFELTRKAMERLEFFENGKIAFTYITIDEQKEAESNSGDYEGIVNIGRNVEGVEVSVFARETSKGFKISIRSNSYVDVSKICEQFGGGGHFYAAGCIFNSTIEHVKSEVLNQIMIRL